jgi:hypothetical protein
MEHKFRSTPMQTKEVETNYYIQMLVYSMRAYIITVINYVIIILEKLNP